MKYPASTPTYTQSFHFCCEHLPDPKRLETASSPNALVEYPPAKAVWYRSIFGTAENPSNHAARSNQESRSTVCTTEGTSNYSLHLEALRVANRSASADRSGSANRSIDRPVREARPHRTKSIQHCSPNGAKCSGNTITGISITEAPPISKRELTVPNDVLGDLQRAVHHQNIERLHFFLEWLHSPRIALTEYTNFL